MDDSLKKRIKDIELEVYGGGDITFILDSIRKRLLEAGTQYQDLLSMVPVGTYVDGEVFTSVVKAQRAIFRTTRHLRDVRLNTTNAMRQLERKRKIEATLDSLK